MSGFFDTFLENLHELHDGIRASIHELPPQALNWSPGAGMNSMSVLVFHLTSAERYWLGDVLLGEPSGSVRPHTG